jgi:predicted hydrocarbon binding protein
MGRSGLWQVAKGGAGVAPSTIQVRAEFVKSEFGEQGVRRLHEAVSPPLRALLQAGDPRLDYVDFALFVEMNVAVDNLFGNGDLTLVKRMGHFAASHSAGVWTSMFARGMDIPTFVGIAAGVWHKHYDSGSLVTRELDPRTVELEIKNFAVPHRAHCVSVIGWLEGIFELDPRSKVAVEELACRAAGNPRCALAIRWEPVVASPPAG